MIRDKCGVCGGDGSTCRRAPANQIDGSISEDDQILPVRNNDFRSVREYSKRDSELVVEQGAAFDFLEYQNDDSIDEHDYSRGGGVLNLDDIAEHLWQPAGFSPCSVTCGSGRWQW